VITVNIYNILYINYFDIKDYYHYFSCILYSDNKFNIACQSGSDNRMMIQTVIFESCSYCKI